jgi:hypothetical protein
MRDAEEGPHLRPLPSCGTVRRVSALLPPPADALVSLYLELVDAEAPGLIAGLYLVGSLGLDDFRPGHSDVDFVAVVAAPIEPPLLGVLERVHAQLTARLPQQLFEGIYLTPDDLRGEPAEVIAVPYVHQHRFQAAGRFELNPVTWATLARHGIAVRGPAVADLAIRDDPAVLDRWTRQNLVEYWRPWQARHSRLLSWPGLSALRPWATEWGVLGVSRLHYTLTTGRITSKYGAGLYAMRRFPRRWHRPILEALSIRRGNGVSSVYRTTFARRADLLRYVAMAIDDGLALPPRSP